MLDVSGIYSQAYIQLFLLLQDFELSSIWA